LTVLRPPLFGPLRSPLRSPLALRKGGGRLPPGYDYYVAPSVAGADDSNDGSRSAPFATHAAVRTLIDGLGGSDEVSIYIEGKVYAEEHLSWSTTAASGAIANIYLGAGYILDGTDLTTGGINVAGGSGWTINVVALGGVANRAIIRDFLQASANAIGLTGANNLTVSYIEVTNCEDGCSNHTSGGTLTTNDCYIHDNTRSEIVHAGGTSIHNNDLIVAKGDESVGFIVTSAGSSTTFNDCTLTPAGTYGTSFPASGATGGLYTSLEGTVVFNGGTFGDIGTKSVYVALAPAATFNDVVVDVMTDGNKTLTFNDCAGYFTTRSRSGGAFTFRNCDWRGPSTNRPTSVFGASNTASMLVDIGTLGVPKWDMLDCMVTGFASAAIGQAMDATEAAALVAVSGFQIKNNAFFGNGTNIDADIVSADGGTDIADNITDDPLLSLTPGDAITSWGYRPGSPCIGAGTAGGNIGFATAA